MRACGDHHVSWQPPFCFIVLVPVRFGGFGVVSVETGLLLLPLGFQVEEGTLLLLCCKRSPVNETWLSFIVKLKPFQPRNDYTNEGLMIKNGR